MTKQIEPPKVEKNLSELSKDEFVTELAKFQEALKSESFKDVDVYKTLGIEAPKPETKAPESNINQDVIDRVLPAYTKAREELVNAGFNFKEVESKMSEAEKEIHERLEKQALAKFSEQKQEVTKIDADFPTEVIEGLNISTDDKTLVMAGIKEVVSRNSEAVEKVQKELDKVTAELQEVKMSAPAPQEDKAGEDIVSGQMAKFGLKEQEETQEE